MPPYRPTAAMARNAKRAQEWNRTLPPSRRAMTTTGRRRAGQLARRDDISVTVLKKMILYFLRHQVDKDAEGFLSGEEGYPSKGRIAWDGWGGDAGFSWARKWWRHQQRLDGFRVRFVRDPETRSASWPRGQWKMETERAG